MVGGSAHLRGVLLFATSAFAAPPALASGWSIDAGEQKWFSSVSRESGDFGQAWRADDFTEFGLGDGWEVTAKVETEIRIGSTYDDRSGFRIGLQKAFPIGERASFSLQTSFLGGESLDGLECAGEGYEARAAIGTSFTFSGLEGFVNIEGGHRVRGDCERNVTEIASGLTFSPGWDLGLKAWQDGSGSSGSTKAEVSVSHDFWGVGVGVGWREEISGNFSEKGWVVSARARF